MTTNPVVNELLNLAAKLRLQRAEIMHRFEKALAEHDKKIEHVEATLRMYADAKQLGEVRSARITPDDIRGMPQLKALITIAQANGGMVNSAEAKRLFLAAGLVRGNPKHAGPHIYSLLKASDRFEWVSPGTFRLVNGLSEKQPPMILVQGD